MSDMGNIYSYFAIFFTFVSKALKTDLKFGDMLV